LRRNARTDTEYRTQLKTGLLGGPGRKRGRRTDGFRRQWHDERQSAPGTWLEVGRGVTDADGRIARLLEGPLEAGAYRLTFDTGAYFRSQAATGFCFYPHVTVEFEVRDAGQHHHVPLLLSPYGYSTYRGS
jgi:5-hydroxyisourate hydrolase